MPNSLLPTLRAATIALAIATSFAASAQSIDDLNKEKEKLQAIIENNNRLLTEYANRRNSEMMQISVVDQKISKRKSLIDIYNAEIKVYNDQITLIGRQIDSVKRETEKQKQAYADMLRHIQKSDLVENPLAYILSSNSFNQGYRRLLFMKQYSGFRKNQLAQLNESQQTLTALKDRTAEKLNQINIIISQVKTETKLLDSELSARKTNIENISKSQDDLTRQITKAQEQTRLLEAKIEQIIKEEAEKARREAEEARKRAEAEAKAKAEKTKKNNAKGSKATPAPETPAETPATPLAKTIADSKGRLPWPVSPSVVTSHYGEHDHPLIPSIKIRNNGIDIDVLASKGVKPVFEGVVSRIIMIPGSNASIIIRHGDVLTVYSNLAEVFVKKDQKVDLSTNLGTVFAGEGLNSNILHFELWLGDQKQDPEAWLKAK